jgi:c-di-GMP-binding flagellar brake protein YcgR
LTVFVVPADVFCQSAAVNCHSPDHFSKIWPRSACGCRSPQAEEFTCGVQFIDLEPNHYALLQNMTYEALIADRQKIV